MYAHLRIPTLTNVCMYECTVCVCVLVNMCIITSVLLPVYVFVASQEKSTGLLVSMATVRAGNDSAIWVEREMKGPDLESQR